MESTGLRENPQPHPITEKSACVRTFPREAPRTVAMDLPTTPGVDGSAKPGGDESNRRMGAARDVKGRPSSNRANFEIKNGGPESWLCPRASSPITGERRGPLYHELLQKRRRFGRVAPALRKSPRLFLPWRVALVFAGRKNKKIRPRGERR